MSVENTVTKIIYQGNGATTEWPVPFSYSQTDDIHLIQTDSAGLETPISGNFQVNVNESGDTSVTYPVTGLPLAVGFRLTIYRDTPHTQIVDLVNGGAFSPDVLEHDGFDRLQYQIQEIQEEVDRSVKVAISGSVTPDELRDGLFEARDQAEASAGLARQWASNPEGVAVVGGLYSSLHYSRKASLSELEAERLADEAAEHETGAMNYATQSASHATDSAASAAESDEILQEIKTMQGAATYLTSNNFGDPSAAADWQQTLTDYAVSQVPGWTKPNNSTFVVNLWNGHEWVYNSETGLWTDYGEGAVQQFTNDTLGTIKGDATAFGAVNAQADGTGKVNVAGATSTVMGYAYLPTDTELESGEPDEGREGLPIVMPLGKGGSGDNGLPLLSLLWSTTPLSEPGFLDISQDNGLLSRAAFPEAWAKIATLPSAVLLTDTAWLAEKVANSGACGKYSSGDGSTTFRVPLIDRRFIRATDSDLPVGTAQGDAIKTHQHYIYNATQAAVGSPTASNYMGQNNAGSGDNFKPVGASTTPSLLRTGAPISGVDSENRPVSIAYVPLLKMYGAVTEASEANIAALIQATANKLDTSVFQATQQAFYCRDEKNSATSGGTFTTGAWRVRDLGTVEINTIPGASLSGNQITLPIGTYEIFGSAPAIFVGQHTARLFNVTTNSMITLGTLEYSATVENAMTRSTVRTILTVTQTIVIRLEHYCRNTRANDGFGTGTGNTWTNNIYAEVFIRRLS